VREVRSADAAFESGAAPILGLANWYTLVLGEMSLPSYRMERSLMPSNATLPPWKHGIRRTLRPKKPRFCYWAATEPHRFASTGTESAGWGRDAIAASMGLNDFGRP
jgi:hypothetical protein